MRDAVRYWESRRLWYNLVLTVVVLAWVVWTWPHFRPALTLRGLGIMVVLAALANVCYSAVYLIEIALAFVAPERRRYRQVIYIMGMLCAVVFECYWIADEIYPYVG